MTLAVMEVKRKDNMAAVTASLTNVDDIGAHGRHGDEQQQQRQLSMPVADGTKDLVDVP